MAKIKYSMDAFKSHFVEVVTTSTVSVTSDSEVGSLEKKQPIIISGIFLAHDEENIYLGDEEGILSDTISKLQYVHVGISKKRDRYDDLMDGDVRGGNN